MPGSLFLKLVLYLCTWYTLITMKLFHSFCLLYREQIKRQFNKYAGNTSFST